MGKLILFLIIIASVYFLFFKKKEIKNENTDESKDLILCDKCQTFYPKEEIKKINGKNICRECYDNS